MLKIIFLGTAASIASKERDNTSLLIYRKSYDFILIDCPGSIVQKLKRIGLDYTRLNKIIITHHHPDHVYGLISLLHSQFKTNEKIEIYSSKTSIEIIKKMVRIFKLKSNNYPRIYFRDVFSKKPFLSHNDMKISAFKNKHSSLSFGINIIYKNKNVVYSSDTAITKAILPLIKKSTYLIHDCTASSKFFKQYPSLYKMHTESSQLNRLATKIKPKLIIPVHFLLLRRQELACIKRELKGINNIFFPTDYSSIKIR